MIISYRAHSRLNARQAFTLIELLVVIAIIAILMGLLLSAVQHIRQAAARLSCQNNVKQLALAVHNYENARGYFPPYGVFGPGWQPIHSWSSYVLPYIEQDNVFRQYSFNHPWNDPVNQPAVSTKLKVFICPAAPSDRENVKDGLRFGLTDYSANFGLDQILNTGLLSPWSGDPIGAWNHAEDLFGRGARVIDIRDGTSSTILLVEIAGRPQLWRKGRLLSGTTPIAGWATFDNNTLPIDLDGAAPDGTSTPGPCPINCYNGHEVYSFHTAGANVAFADGSVHFLRESLPIQVMAALITRRGGEVISGEDF